MLRLTIIACSLLLAVSADVNSTWWKNAVVYQIYPRSFKDSNGDGIGDLNGISSKLEHIADIGANALWLSPIYKSPQVDFGYDIANYTDVDPDYGTLADFDRLVTKARSLGLKVILDFVPNHSSHEHPWFKKSIQRIKPYDEYYVWRNASIVNGTRQPPNNWLNNFQGSAWEWNQVRQQYYLHQFSVGQPDLNYRSPALREEISNALSFWMNRGVSGFRIDVMNHLYEDARFPNEPSANRTDLPKGDYDSLVHIYTRDQNENFDVLRSWRKLLDEHSNRTRSDPKMILTEAYTRQELMVKFYEAGSTVPFNFMFITDLDNRSSAADFKRLIDRWVSTVPKDSVANWVVGNHDNHRVATRFGSKRADQISMLAMILPGVAVIYNGDEIGMEDRNFTYAETIDVAGCRLGPNRYYLKSRDPERTPYQWDNTTSAGFSDRLLTWLPVNSNYRTLNLAAQKRQVVSHYAVFKALTALKNKLVIASGSLNVTVVNGNVLGVVRRFGLSIVALLINLSDVPVVVNARVSMGLPSDMVVYTSSVGSNIQTGSWVYPMALSLPASASVVYTTPNLPWN
ncbi:Maltase 2 [Eufriesea mexicana]|uniref:maltase 2-like n=1 Tax=Eufriesea mexicana TaxID=516756 RepID=UPI00083BB4D8|nr:PREDICTED: maltase 2-like [Eufriesea mexicana]OAD59185.1 Maltase 2 [Eufriesea mexicana]